MKVLSARLDLNQRPPVSEAGTLNQLSYWLTEPSFIDKVEPHVGVEPTADGWHPPMLTDTPMRHGRGSANRTQCLTLPKGTGCRSPNPRWCPLRDSNSHHVSHVKGAPYQLGEADILYACHSSAIDIRRCCPAPAPWRPMACGAWR